MNPDDYIDAPQINQHELVVVLLGALIHQLGGKVEIHKIPEGVADLTLRVTPTAENTFIVSTHEVIEGQEDANAGI